MNKIILLLPLALAACSGPEGKLRESLADAGLSKKQSACMAKRMYDKLSLKQLIRLSSLGNFSDTKVTDMSIDDFLHNVRALKDPEIFTITSKAAVSCAISS